MTASDEENLTAAAKTAAVLEAAAKTITAAADKAKANGLSTKADSDDSRKSVNRTTWASVAAMIIAVYTIVHFVIDPVVKEQERQGAVLLEAQKDIRELYRVSSTERSPRLERPVDVVPPK